MSCGSTQGFTMGQQGADAGLGWGCSGLSGVTVAPEVVAPCCIQIGASDVAQPLESRLSGCTHAWWEIWRNFRASEPQADSALSLLSQTAT